MSQATTGSPALLSVAEAAAHIGMSDRWLWDRIRQRELAVVAMGRRRLVRPEDLEAFVNERLEGQGEAAP